MLDQKLIETVQICGNTTPQSLLLKDMYLIQSILAAPNRIVLHNSNQERVHYSSGQHVQLGKRRYRLIIHSCPLLSKDRLKPKAMLMLAYRTYPSHLLVLILDLPIPIQLTHRNILLPTHSHSLPSSIRLFQELSQSLLTFL